MGFPNLSPQEIRDAKAKGESHAHKKYAAVLKGATDQDVRLNALLNFSQACHNIFLHCKEHFADEKLAHHRDDTPADEQLYATSMFEAKAAVDLLSAIFLIEAARGKGESAANQLCAIQETQKMMSDYLAPHDTARKTEIRGRACCIIPA